jgi:hypothetical protein
MLNPIVLHGSDARLSELAIAAVKEWRWRPGMVNGEPVDVFFAVNVKFHTH